MFEDGKYFDHCATTKMIPEAVEKMHEVACRFYGNPSSPHHLGFVAEKMLKGSRDVIAKSLGVSPDNLTFTSGGTEADNLAVLGYASKVRNDKRKAIVGMTEHAAVQKSAQELARQGWDIIWLPVDNNGIADLNALEDLLNPQVSLVSIMHVNNETGAVNDINYIGRMVKESSNAMFHVDAVQSWGKYKLKDKIDNVDFLSLSGHKIGAPKGIGVLFSRKKNDLTQLLWGGGQEDGLRPGTENMPGIAALAEAARIAEINQDRFMQTVTSHRRTFIQQIAPIRSICRLNSLENDYQRSAPYIFSISFPGYRGEILINALSDKGFCLSTGAACSSRRHEPSHVLKAMGLKENEIEGTLRISFSMQNTADDVIQLANTLIKILQDLAIFKRR